MPEGITPILNSVLDELAELFSRLDETQVEKLVDAMLGDGRLFVAGAGRSGLLLQCFTMRLMHIGLPVHMIGDVTTPGARPGDMLLLGSGSGETGSLVAMATKAKSLGIKVLLITANPASTIARMANVSVVLPGPTPKSVGEVHSVASAQPMGSLFEQGMFILLDGIVMKLMERKKVTAGEMFARHASFE